MAKYQTACVTYYRPQALHKSSSLADRRHKGVDVAPQLEHTDLLLDSPSVLTDADATVGRIPLARLAAFTSEVGELALLPDRDVGAETGCCDICLCT